MSVVHLDCFYTDLKNKKQNKPVGCIMEISCSPCISVISLLPLGEMSMFSSSGVEQTEQMGHTVPFISEDTKPPRSEEQRWRADAEQTRVFLRLHYISYSIRHLSYDCLFPRRETVVFWVVCCLSWLMNSKACTRLHILRVRRQQGVGVMTLQCTPSCVCCITHLRLIKRLLTPEVLLHWPARFFI